jgi:hypothetical protein
VKGVGGEGHLFLLSAGPHISAPSDAQLCRGVRDKGTRVVVPREMRARLSRSKRPIRVQTDWQQRQQSPAPSMLASWPPHAQSVTFSALRTVLSARTAAVLPSAVKTRAFSMSLSMGCEGAG